MRTFTARNETERPDAVTDEKVEAAGKLSEALESVERPRGRPDVGANVGDGGGADVAGG